MLLPGPASFNARLVGKRVLLKASLFSRAFLGTIASADDIGFCFISDDLISALRELTGSAIGGMDRPNVYLPFSTIEWVVFSEAKSATALA